MWGRIKVSHRSGDWLPFLPGVLAFFDSHNFMILFDLILWIPCNFVILKKKKAKKIWLFCCVLFCFPTFFSAEVCNYTISMLNATFKWNQLIKNKKIALGKEFLFHSMCYVTNENLLKIRISEICVKRICINQGVGVFLIVSPRMILRKQKKLFCQV